MTDKYNLIYLHNNSCLLFDLHNSIYVFLSCRTSGGKKYRIQEVLSIFLH